MSETIGYPTFPVGIDWGVAAATLPGQAESGDLHLIAPFPRGVLVAVVDGLGHGSEAAAAARIAVATLASSAGESPINLIQRCHERLAGTRGVALSLAVFTPRDTNMAWLGVGNVEGVLLPAAGRAGATPQSLLLRGGVVGYRLPPLRVRLVDVQPGDTLIVATDGIRRGFVDEPTAGRSPQAIADEILARCGSDADDALVLVARRNGAEIGRGRHR